MATDIMCAAQKTSFTNSKESCLDTSLNTKGLASNVASGAVANVIAPANKANDLTKTKNCPKFASKDKTKVNAKSSCSSLTISKLSAALALAVHSAIVPLCLGSLIVPCEEAQAFVSLLEDLKKDVAITIDESNGLVVGDGTNSSGYVIHRLVSGEHEWNATVTFTGKNSIKARTQLFEGGLNYHGSGSLVVDLDTTDTGSLAGTGKGLTFNSKSLGQNKELIFDLDTINVKNGYLNFETAGGHSLVKANKIIVGGEDTRSVAFLRLSDPQEFTLGGHHSEIYLNKNGSIQTPATGVTTIQGQLLGTGGTLISFTDKSKPDNNTANPKVNVDDLGLSLNLNNSQGNLSSGSILGVNNSVGQSGHEPMPSESNNRFVMKLWNDSEKGAHFNLDLAHGSTTVFDIKDNASSYHNNEGLLHMGSGTITLRVAGLEGHNTQFEIANGTFHVGDDVEIITDNAVGNAQGKNTTQMIISKGGILKNSFGKFKDYLGLNADNTIHRDAAFKGSSSSNGADKLAPFNDFLVTSQLVFNGGTIWFTDEEQFDVIDNFASLNFEGTNHKSPLVINSHLNGDNSKDEIFSSVYVKNALIKKSVNTGMGDVDSSDLDMSHLALITNHLSLCEENDADNILTLGNSKNYIVARMSNNNGDELTIRTAKTTNNKAQFYFNNDALDNIDPAQSGNNEGLEIAIENLILDHGVEFYFEAGNWHGHNLTLQQGATMDIGNPNHVHGALLDMRDNSLTFGTGANVVTVHEDGALKVGKLDLAQGNDKSTLNIYGKVEITGNNKDLLEDEHDWFYKTEKDDRIVLSGDRAELIFDNKVLSNVSFNDKDEVVYSNGDATFTNSIALANGATLTLQFGSERNFTIAQVQNLVDQILADHQMHDNSTIDFGQANIDAVSNIVTDGTIDYDTLKNLHNQFSVLEHLKINSLKEATVTNVKDQVVDGHAGAISLSSGFDSANLGGGSLSCAVDGKFIVVEGSDEAGSFKLSENKRFTLNNGGRVNEVSLGKNSSLSINSQEGITKLNNIQGGEASATFVSGKTEIAHDVELETIVSKSDSQTVVAGDLATKHAYLAGDVDVAGRVTLGHGNFEHSYVYNGASFKARELNISPGSIVAIGLSAKSAQHYLVDPTAKGSAGYLEVESLSLNGGTLISDPDYGNKASIIAIKNVHDSPNIAPFETQQIAQSITGKQANNSASGSAATISPVMPQDQSAAQGNNSAAPSERMVLDGNLVAAMNSILMVGEDASIELAHDLFGKYLDSNGSLNKDKVGAIAYLGSNLTIANGQRFIVDPDNGAFEIVGTSGKDDGLLNQNATTDGIYAEESIDYKGGVSTNADLYLGPNTILGIGANVSGTAIHFDKNDATILAGGDGAKIVLFGKINDYQSKSSKASSDDKEVREIVLFTDNDNNGMSGVHLLGHHDIRVESANGFKFSILKPGQDTSTDPIILEFDKNKKPEDVFNEASKPGQDGLGDIIEDGKELEDVIRMEAFGGVVHATLNSLEATTNLVNERMGSALDSELAFGSNLWAQAVYRKQDTHDLAAQGITYGNELDLRGAALGFDYSGYNQLGFSYLYGIVFNVGNGEVKGNGAATNASNDFNYYGASLYGALQIGNFELNGDLSYVHLSHDLSTKNSITKLETSLDSSALSMALMANYKLKFEVNEHKSVELKPYVGMRYSHLAIDDYAIKGQGYGTIAKATTEDINLVTVPMGVKLSFEELKDNLSHKITLDLGLKTFMGDDLIINKTAFSNLDNYPFACSSELASETIYHGQLNYLFSSDNWHFSLNSSYGRSADRSLEEFSLNAMVSMSF